MRFSTICYSFRQGIKNICRNSLFSLASVATISACIFLFCLFFAVIANVRNITHLAETTIGITVFFDEDMSQEEIQALGEEISARPEIREMNFVSADQAWENFKSEYFAGMEELADGFADDNPLASSASYEVFLQDIGDQDEMVAYLQGLDGVRKVNYSRDVAAGFSGFSRLVGALSAAIIGILLAVSVFLISNTIHVAAAFRKTENQIMRLIGATNFMIRAPFVVEGTVLGLVGALIPLGAMYILYRRAVTYMGEHFLGTAGGLGGVLRILPIEELFPVMAAVSLALGVGIGFFVSFFTIRKHLKV